MLAELHGKFDPENADNVARSEDSLTSAVFGAIRYLPRVVLGVLLKDLGVAADPKALQSARIEMWPWVPMTRWPGQSIEPDVLLVVGRQPIVVEAKLHSPFGLYDDPTAPAIQRLHQLAVQYAAVSAWARGERLLPPIVVAVTAPPERPTSDLKKAAADLARLGLAPEADPFRWLPWHRIAALVASVDELEVHEQALVEDLLAFMDRRGVRKVFKGFQQEDYWLIAAAQRVAGDRLYPQVQDFVNDLAAVLDDDGVRWSTPDWRSMWLPGGTSLAKPSDWRRGWMGILLWPEGWPERQGKQLGYTALYVVFDFINPAIEIGFALPGAGVGATIGAWPPHLSDLAAALNSMPNEYEIVTDAGDMANPSKTASSRSVDEEWLASTMPSMTTTSRLRLRRRVDPFQVTVSQVRDTILELRDDINRIGDSFWSLLRSVNYIK